MCSLKRVLVLIMMAVTMLCFSSAALCRADNFTLTVGRQLEVLHGSRLLIAGDELTYGPGWEAGKIKVKKRAGMTIVNTFHKDDNVLQYRREVGVNKDRIELTCQFRLFAYKNTPEKGDMNYIFRIPYERVKNSTLKGAIGRGWGPKAQEVELGETHSDGTLLSEVHYAAFAGENIELVIDMHPKGLYAVMDYGGGGFIGMWEIRKKGDYVEFSCGYGAKFYGGTYAGKVLIYEGKYDFENVHSLQGSLYIGDYRIDNRYYFGWQQDGEGLTKADTVIHTPDRGFGWENSDGVAVTTNPGKGVVHNAAYGTGKHVFVIDVTPGIYAVSLRAGGIDAGPFDVALNGKVKARNIVVKADKVTNIHMWEYIRAEKLHVEFLPQHRWFSPKSRWAVSTIIPQPIIYAYEDFAFDRGPWLVEGIFTPE